MLVFGETAVVGSRRDADGLPVPLRAFAVTAPSGSAHAVPVVEIARSGNGTLALRGPMVPRHAFPPGADRLGTPHLKADAEGFVDTFYPCRLDWHEGTVEVTGPPPSVVSVGSYRFRAERVGGTGSARRRQRLRHRPARCARRASSCRHFRRWRCRRAELAELGVNPLIVDAFHDGNLDAA